MVAAVDGPWSQRPSDRRRRTGRGFGAAALSLVVPGAGHLAVGRPGRGALLLAATGLTVTVAAWVTSLDTATLIGWLVRPGGPEALLAANGLVLLLRGFAAVDAFRIGARPRVRPAVPRRRSAALGVALALGLLLAVGAAPHALAGYYAVRTQDALDAIFVAAAPTPVTIRATTLGPDPDRTAVDLSAVALDPGLRLAVERWTAPAPALPPPNPWLDDDRITVAVLGSDAGPGRWAARLDTMMVVTIDTATGDAAVFSIDRYLRDFPVPERLAEVYREHCVEGDGWAYLNALYTCGAQRVPEVFAALYPDVEDPAAAAVADTLGELLGLHVAHHVLVDMAGFVRIVDAFGGVEVEVADPIQVELSPPDDDGAWQRFDLPAGVQELDGESALAYVRSRTGSSDADRMRRQRCLLASLSSRTDAAAIALRLPDLLGAVEDHVGTDIPTSLLPDLVGLIDVLDPARLVTIGLGPPDYRGRDHVPDVALIRDRVAQVLDDPELALEASRTAERDQEVCR